MYYGTNYVDSSKYQLLSDAYFGNGGFYDGSYIIQAPSENSEKYSYRKSVSQYQNEFRQIVDANIIPVGSDVDRTYEGELLETFASDCDGLGTSFSRFMDSVRLEALLYGYTIVIMDTTAEQPETLAEAFTQRTYPKLIKITPKQIEYYELAGENELTFLSYKSGEEEGVAEYTVYDNGVFYTSSKPSLADARNARLTEEKEALVEPWVFTYETYFDPWTLPESRYLGCADTAKLIYNLESLIAYQGASTTFNILLNPDVTMKQSNKEGETIMSLSEDSMWNVNVNATGGKMPEFISPNDTMSQIRDQIDSLKSGMYQSQNLNVLSTSADASGDSRAYSDLIRIEGLQDVARKSQEFEQWLLESFQMLSGDASEFIIQYPSEFAAIMTKDKLETKQIALDAGLGEGNQRIIKTSMMNDIFPNATQEERETFIQNEEANTLYNSGDFE